MERNTLIVQDVTRIRAAMSATRVDGQYLAAAAGVTRQFISLVLLGRRRCNPTIASAIARELRAPVAALFTSNRLSGESNNMTHNAPSAIAEIDDPLLLFDEVADLYRINPKTLRNMRYAGDGPPFFRRGQRLMIRKSKAEQWFRETYEDAAAE